MNIFLGFDFYGAGNIGDDLVLAGFLSLLPAGCQLTGVIPRNPSSQQRRFPEINWIQGGQDARATAIQDCDIWMGVGATPFSAEHRAWLLQHIKRDLALCHQYKKSAVLVGVDAEKTLLTSSYRGLGSQILRQLQAVITRDTQSVEILNTLEPTAAADIRPGMDLANLFLTQWTPPERRARSGESVGVCYWEEEMDPRQLRRLRAALRCLHGMGKTVCFFANEVRRGYDDAVYHRVTRLRDRWRLRRPMRLVRPDFARATLEGLLAHYAAFDIVVSSRYHALLTAAWMGCPALAIGKRQKVACLAQDLSLPLLRPPWSASLLCEGVTRAVSGQEAVQRYHQERLADLRSGMETILGGLR